MSVKPYLLSVVLLGLGCANPQQTGLPNPPISPPQIIPSTQERPAPQILGVDYVGTIGRPGQGAAQFLRPAGLAVSAHEIIYIADAGNSRVQALYPDGTFAAEFGARGWRTGEFDSPTDVAIGFQRTELLYVVDAENDRVQYCNLIDRIFRVWAGAVSDGVSPDTELNAPRGMGIGRNGEVYIVDTGNHRFIRFSPDGRVEFTEGRFGSGREQLRNPTDIVADSQGNIYLTDTGNHRIKKYDFSGNLVAIWGAEGTADGQFREPTYLTRDSWNYLYVTDSVNRRIQVLSRTGVFVTAFSHESLAQPNGIAVSRSGRVYVSDATHHDLKVFEVVYQL